MYKSKQKRQLTFGELVEAAYEVWGDRADRMLSLAIKAHMVVFPKQQPLLAEGSRSK